jgi:flagellar biosynthesis/type III secretory pathway protein FliH
MRVQPLNQIPKSRSQSAKGSESVKGSLSGIRRLGSSQQPGRTQALPQNWQEHEIDAGRDRVAISDDARKWQQGEWLDEGLKPGENPKTTAEEVVRNPQFAKHAQKIHKPRIQLREMAKKSQQEYHSEGVDNGLEDGVQSGLGIQNVDPKIAMASRHAPLESMF